MQRVWRSDELNKALNRMTKFEISWQACELQEISDFLHNTEGVASARSEATVGSPRISICVDGDHPAATIVVT